MPRPIATVSRCAADRLPGAGSFGISFAPLTDFNDALQQVARCNSLCGNDMKDTQDMDQPSPARTAILAEDAPLRQKASIFPEPFASRMPGRAVQALGDVFGLQNFDVNLATLMPGAVSAPSNAHGSHG
jgi:hypothetical protein